MQSIQNRGSGSSQSPDFGKCRISPCRISLGINSCAATRVEAESSGDEPESGSESEEE